jgi:hypothetical protein
MLLQTGASLHRKIKIICSVIVKSVVVLENHRMYHTLTIKHVGCTVRWRVCVGDNQQTMVLVFMTVPSDRQAEAGGVGIGWAGSWRYARYAR